MARDGMDLQTAFGASRPVVLEFYYSKDCAHCRESSKRLHEVERAHPEVSWVMVDTQDESNRVLWERLGVDEIPHFAFLDAGKELRRTEVGPISTDRAEAGIRSVMCPDGQAYILRVDGVQHKKPDRSRFDAALPTASRPVRGAETTKRCEELPHEPYEGLSRGLWLPRHRHGPQKQNAGADEETAPRGARGARQGATAPSRTASPLHRAGDALDDGRRGRDDAAVAHAERGAQRAELLERRGDRVAAALGAGWLASARLRRGEFAGVRCPRCSRRCGACSTCWARRTPRSARSWPRRPSPSSRAAPIRVEIPRHRADAATETTSRRWRRAPEI